MGMSQHRSTTCQAREICMNAVSFQVSAPGADGSVHPFQKPVFTAALLCSANAALFIVIVLLRRSKSFFSPWRHGATCCRSPCSAPNSALHPHNEVLYHSQSFFELVSLIAALHTCCPGGFAAVPG